MSTPSERIFAQLEGGDGTELRDILPPRARHPMTLAHTADRIVGGVALREAVADFVDDLRWARDDDDVAQRITERSRDLDPRTDAYLGGLAEHVATERGLTAPLWSGESGRFLPGSGGRAILDCGPVPSWSRPQRFVGGASCLVPEC